MKSKVLIFSTIFMVSMSLSTFSQSKKDLKANKVKSCTEWKAVTGNDKPIKECYEEYDINGRTILKIEYKKDGTVKSKSTYKFDKYGNKIEETEMSSKTGETKKTVSKYNAQNDKTEEIEYSETNQVLKKNTYKYDSNGFRIEKRTFDAQDQLIELKKWEYK